MLPPIPSLEAYRVSSQFGFLPSVPPLERLPDPYYNKWESIVANLQGFILSKRLRQVIDHLPVLSTTGLLHESEWRRAYSILCFMAHSYIWGHDTPSERLPPSISIPLLNVSEYLEVPPVATYAAVCLWNFKGLFVDESIENLDNLATLTTFTGSIDESWFYLISVAIEAQGAQAIPLMLRAIEAARLNDWEMVTYSLQKFAEIIDQLGRLLVKMYDRCDPHIFYHRIRPFLAGSKDMKDAGLANGIIYEDGSGNEEFRQFAGGSNAQSSLIQFFDIVLGIEHLPTCEERDDCKTCRIQDIIPAPSYNFIIEMRKYMPGPHRRFLEDVSKVANIRDYVHANRNNDDLTLAYDACLKMLSDFRSAHIKIVSRYIVVKSRETSPKLYLNNPRSQFLNLDFAQSSHKLENTPQKYLKGTGGTSLILFLKQARDETCHSAANAWAKRIMSRNSNHNWRNFNYESRSEESPSINLAVSNFASIPSLASETDHANKI